MATQVESPNRGPRRGIVNLCDDDDDEDDESLLSAANSNDDDDEIELISPKLGAAVPRQERETPRRQTQSRQYAALPAKKHDVVTLFDDDDNSPLSVRRGSRRKRSRPQDDNDDEVQFVEDDHAKAQQQSTPSPARKAHATTTPRRAAKNSPKATGVARMPLPVAVPTAAIAKRNRLLESDDDDDDDDVVTILSPRQGNLKQGDDHTEVEFVKGPAAAGTARRRRRNRHNGTTTIASAAPPPPQEAAPPQEPQPSWMRVMEVFPDAQVEHVKSLLQNNQDNVTAILCHMADKGYSKAENPELLQPTRPAPTVTLPEAPPARKVSTDFYSTNSFTPNSIYKKEVVPCIVAAFPFLTSAGAKIHLQKAQYHYAVCHDQIRKALVCGSATPNNNKDKKAVVMDKDQEEAEEERQYKSFKYILNCQQDLTVEERARLFALAQRSTVASNPITNHRRNAGAVLTITDQTLKEEVDFVNEQMTAWMTTMDARVARRQAREDCKRNGTAVSCKCCFDEFALEEMVACREEGHLFCIDCIASYAENQIFGAGSFGTNAKTKKAAMELLCMHGDGCSSGFQTTQLRKALSEKVLVKYDELQFQKAMDCANMDDMCACPKCGFQAALPTTEMIFRCPVAGCQYESCRKCGEPPHIPLRCEEVEKQVETNGRVTVEEAISKAKIRTCPKCKQSFIKSDGCNKMRCPCGLLICYICRAQINGYDHFCQQPHCTHESCNKCKLHSNAEEDDKRAMREAGLQAAELVRKECLQKQQEEQQQPQIMLPGLKKPPPAPVDVQVDVEKLLSDSPAKK